MSVIDQITSFLAKKPALEWVGPDLFVVASSEAETVLQVTTPLVTAPINHNFWKYIHGDDIDINSLLIPTATGLFITSFGFILARKIFSHATAAQRAKDKSTKRGPGKTTESPIRRQFQNQSERTISIMEELVSRAPSGVPEVVIFFASEESTVTALKLCVKLMQLIFLAKGEEKKFEEIEQEHVVSGRWYNGYAVSWHFLNELRSTLDRKTGIIITDYQDVHPYSAALLTFQTKDLLDAQGAYLFLIVNTENTQADHQGVSPEDAAMEWWLMKKLGPYFRPEVLEGIQQELGERSCVVQKEPLSTLMSL